MKKRNATAVLCKKRKSERAEYGQEQRHSDGEEGEKEVEGQACEVFVAANWLAEGTGGGEELLPIRLSVILYFIPLCALDYFDVNSLILLLFTRSTFIAPSR